MEKVLSTLVEETKSFSSIYTPLFFRLKNPDDHVKFKQLLNKPGIMVFDEIVGQVEELVKCRNPKRVFGKGELKQEAINFLGDEPWEKFGVWVFYPWSNRLVHILDEKEFVEVRTNRNQYKITPEEKKLLSKKKIGVIGLSVGQSIALTIAMERICGEIRLADFDKLELSNLNRIRTGVYNLEVLKVVAVAREIAEMDPFLKVTCFTEGLLEENIDDFFLKEGKLDACIEVCDGLVIKILSRYKAKELRVPVIMTSSDRGTTDVERFDINPDLPILHGLIDHLDLSKVKEAKTNEEKVPYLLPMLGIETTSTRLKSSMLEIEQTITTWPQLASGVVLGGTICTDICRRIFLDDFHESGRYFVDVEEIIKDKEKKEFRESPLNINSPISEEEMVSIVHESGIKPISGQIELDKEKVKQIVTAATLAPSGANAQSWKFLYHQKSLFMFFDDQFRPDLLDCKRTTMITGLGAAAENIVLKAHELSFEVVSEVFDIKDDTKLTAVFRFFKMDSVSDNVKAESHDCDELASAISIRVSNRNICFPVKRIESSLLDNLVNTARTIPGADLIILDDKDKISELAEVTARMDRIRYLSKSGHNDFRGEARWTVEEALRTRNGISFQETMDLTPTEFAGFYVSKDWPVLKNLADWKLGAAFEKIQRKWILSSSAVGLLTMPKFDTNDFFTGGRALERVWLAANKNGIDTHPPSLSTLIFNSLEYGPENILPSEMREEALLLLERFNKIFSVDPKRGKVLLLRFFVGDSPKFKALRYHIDEVLKFGKS